MKWLNLIHKDNKVATLMSTILSSKNAEKKKVFTCHNISHTQDTMKVHENMTEQEEENFIKSLNNIGPKDIQSFKDPLVVVKTFNKLIDSTQEVMKFIELQETKRHEITEQSKIALRKIEAIHALLSDYLERTFDERRIIFNEQFKIIDKALENGDNNLLVISLNNVQQLAESSPFKALNDFTKTQKMLSDPNYEFDI